jgi:beta-aspartyl-peptidase (threonine type)
MWLIVASDNGGPGMERAIQILRQGGRALDAVEEGIRLVESNPEDHTVGLGGLPNVLGEMELDASIMDGRTLAAGAVGALRGYAHPISVARLVMERTAHVMLVGEGAGRFAAEMGFQRSELLTDVARRRWREAMGRMLSPQEIDELGEREKLLPIVLQPMTERLRHGTIDFLVRDQQGDIACGVSTSGWPWKYPGRLGDSPIIGAGGYADNRFGAAACTLYGELAIRAGTARSVVLYMKMGMSVEEACWEAMRDLEPMLKASGGAMNIVAMDKDGHPFGITSRAGQHPYLVASEEADAARFLDRVSFADGK